jgi:hypothetical protein
MSFMGAPVYLEGAPYSRLCVSPLTQVCSSEHPSLSKTYLYLCTLTSSRNRPCIIAFCDTQATVLRR